MGRCRTNRLLDLYRDKYLDLCRNPGLVDFFVDQFERTAGSEGGRAPLPGDGDLVVLQFLANPALSAGRGVLTQLRGSLHAGPFTARRPVHQLYRAAAVDV